MIATIQIMTNYILRSQPVMIPSFGQLRPITTNYSTLPTSNDSFIWTVKTDQDKLYYAPNQ